MTREPGNPSTRLPRTGAVTLPPDTAALVPGVYVQSIDPVPENPKRKQGVPFAFTFINTTGT